MLPKGRIARNIVTLTGGTAIAQLVTVLASPVVSRLYAPVDMGAFTVYTSLFNILLAVNTLRYEFAIPLPEEEERGIHLVILCIIILPLTTVFFVVVLWLFQDALMSALPNDQRGWVLLFMSLALLGGGLYQAFYYWNVRNKTFRAIAVNRVAQSTSLTLVQMSLGILGLNAGGLVIGHVVSQLTAASGLGRNIWKARTNFLTNLNAQAIWATARLYWRFPVISTWSSLLNSAGLALPGLLFVSLYGNEVGGWFGFAQRVAALPLALIGNATGNVFFAEASRQIQQNPTALRGLYLKLSARLLLLGAFLLLLVFFGPDLFGFVFGEQWRESGIYSQYLALMLFAQFVVSPISHLGVHQLQHWQLTWDFIRVTAIIATLTLSRAEGLSARECVAVYSVTISLLYVVLFFMNLQAIQYRIRAFTEGNKNE